MSHFVAVVLCPKDTDNDNVDDRLKGSLGQYDENRLVPPYQVDCYCVGLIARREAFEAAESEVKPIEDFRKEHRALDGENKPEWSEFIKPFNDAKERFLGKHPLKDLPDATCEDCKGTGKCISQDNLKAKWDWCCIGGRWDGWITGTKVESKDKGFNFGKEHEQLQRNSSPVCVLLDRVKADAKFVPFALVTPDGEWHERGNMGWFGIISDKKDNPIWREVVIDILEKNKDCLAVACDLHI